MNHNNNDREEKYYYFVFYNKQEDKYCNGFLYAPTEVEAKTKVLFKDFKCMENVASTDIVPYECRNKIFEKDTIIKFCEMKGVSKYGRSVR